MMITRKDQTIVPVPFDDIIDPETGRTRIRMLDVASPSYGTARMLQVRLEAGDIDNAVTVDALRRATGLTSDALRARYLHTRA
jgi:6-phosphofructokinase 1